MGYTTVSSWSGLGVVLNQGRILDTVNHLVSSVDILGGCIVVSVLRTPASSAGRALSLPTSTSPFYSEREHKQFGNTVRDSGNL